MTEKEALLRNINAILQEKGLRSINSLGDASQGEIEITGVKEYLEHNQRFYTDVVFRVLFPNNQEGLFPVRFNANSAKSDGAVMVPIINGLFILVRQWRVTLGRYTFELPRGFSEKLDQAQIQSQFGTIKIGDLPLGTLARELGEEVMATGQIISVTHLGNVAENTGTHNVLPSVFLVAIEAEPAKLRERLDQEIQSIAFKTATEVTAAIGQELCDLHTLGALMLATRHLRSLPQLG